MIRCISSFKIFIALSLLLTGVTSCGDDSISDIDVDDIPVVPGFLNAFMADEMFIINDTDTIPGDSASKEVFQERMYSGAGTGALVPLRLQHQSYLTTENDTLTNFETAESLIGEVRLTLQSVQILYGQLFLPIVQILPEASGNAFVWTFDMGVTDSEMVLNIRITAEPADGDDEYLWTVGMKGLYMDDTSIEVKIFEAISSSDGTIGRVQTWMPVLMGGEIFESEIVWRVENQQFRDLTFDFEFDDDDSAQVRTLATYNFNDETSTASLMDSWVFLEGEFDSQFEMNWDIDTRSGNVTLSGEMRCWDEDKIDTLCE